MALGLGTEAGTGVRPGAGAGPVVGPPFPLPSGPGFTAIVATALAA